MSLRHAPRSIASSSASSSTAAAVQLRRTTAASTGAPARPLQYKGGGDAGASAHAAASEGIKGGGGKLPHGEAIQKSFGRHDVSHVQAHVGGDAAKANEQLGAQAYASGDHVAFKGGPDLHTAAHEAAHVVQQKAGVSLKGGVGESGDKYEQHADQVADAVVQGKSAEPILDKMAGSGGASSSVQKKPIQFDGAEECPHQAELDAHQGDKGFLGKVAMVQKGEKGAWEAEHVGEPRDGQNRSRPADTWKGPLKWRAADVAYARVLLGDLDAQVKPKAEKTPVKAQGFSRGKSQTTETDKDGNGTVTKTNDKTTRGHAVNTTDTTKHTQDKAGNVTVDTTKVVADRKDGLEIRNTSGRTMTSTPDGEIKVVPKEHDSTVLPVAPAKKPDLVKKEGQILAGAAANSDAWKAFNKKYDLGGGFTLEIEAKALSHAEQISGNLGVTPDSVKGKIEGKASANLGEFKLKLEWTYGGEILGEEAQIKGYVHIAGTAGIEATAALEASAKSVADQKDKSGNNDVSALASAKGEAFAGAKVSATAGARADWKKKPQKNYQEKLAHSVQALITGGAMALTGPVGWLVATAVGTSGGSDAIAWVLDKIIDWGPDGDVALILLEVSGEASAGAGAKGELSAGFEGGKLKLKMGGSLTFGLGAGMGANLILDIVQGPLFLLVVAGELLKEVKEWVLDKIMALVNGAGELFTAIWEYLDADDKVREAVKNKVHEVVGPAERRQMLDKVLDVWVAGESEQAAADIVKFSMTKGDADQVLTGDVLERWREKVPAQMRKAVELNGDTVYWVNALDGVRFSNQPTLRGGHYIEVTWDGESREHNATASADANSSKHDSSFDGYGVRGFKMGGRPVATRRSTYGKSGQIAVGFGSEPEAEASRAGKHGVWPEKKK